MGSMLKFDSDRRELVRERRQARMERKTLRREDREPQAHQSYPDPDRVHDLDAVGDAARRG